jgi:hypothetical protein
MREIILYDKYTSGHHLSYLRIYAAAFTELGYKVNILTTEVKSVEATVSGTQGFEAGNLRVNRIIARKVTEIERTSAYQRGMVHDFVNSYAAFMDFMEIKRNVEYHNLSANSLVFILWFEPFISRRLPAGLLDLFFPYDFAALWFHPSDIKNINDKELRYRDLLYHVPMLSSRKLKFLGLFDELIVTRLNERYQRKVFKLLPDVAEKHPPDLNSEVPCEILARAKGRKIVSLLGSLDKRKEVVSFFNVAENCQRDDLFYVCAGKLHEKGFSGAERAYLANVAEARVDKIYFHDQHVDYDSEFDALFYVSDIIVAVYRNFTSSSNIIGKAAIYAKYLVVADEHLMCETVSKYGIGLCVESGNPEALHSAIQRIIENEARLDGRFVNYVEDHSFEKLKKYLASLA